MILFKLHSKGYLGIPFLLMIIVLYSCNSGRLILKKEIYSNAGKETHTVEIDYQDEYVTSQPLQSAVKLESNESEEKIYVEEDEPKFNPGTFVTFSNLKSEVISVAKINDHSETNLHLNEGENKQFTPSGLKMILVAILFVILGLVFLYYVPYLGPVLAVVFFIGALVYLIVGLYNISSLFFDIKKAPEGAFIRSC